MAGINLFDMLSQAQGGGAMKQVEQQFGLDPSQTQNAVRALLPALSAGLKSNAAQPGGLEALLGALSKGDHSRYLDQPDSLARPETVQDGNAILGKLLGSKDMSRAVASRAAQRTGLTDGLLKKMLPVVATMVMGSLSKQSQQPDMLQALMGAFGGSQQQQVAPQGGLGGLLGGLLGGGQTRAPARQKPDLGVLGGLLDADGDGNALDDIFDMVMKQRR